MSKASNSGKLILISLFPSLRDMLQLKKVFAMSLVAISLSLREHRIRSSSGAPLHDGVFPASESPLSVR